jgi:hypothetical protein
MYYGEEKCQKLKANGEPCDNWAYYLSENLVCCGVHCRKTRVKLPANPNKQEIQDARNKEIIKVMRANKTAGRAGTVVVYKMAMMRAVEDRPGFINIFPNNRHGDRTDGIGMPELSPMRLGPVGACHLLENWWQAHKVYANEVDATTKEPNDTFYKNQKQLYNDTTPHRHKYTKKDKPLYAVHVDKDNKLVKVDYVASRKYYCREYERLATKTASFLKLQDMIKAGYNLQICGYDGYNVNSLAAHYSNPNVVFGHELCLFSLLIGEHPWKDL